MNTTTTTTTTLEEIAPALARWLAPYVAAELAKASTAGRPAPAGAGEYDDLTCSEYVEELGPRVRSRAIDFFSALDTNGRIDSLELAKVLGIASPRYIASNMTNSLKQRADTLRLSRPWAETANEDDRTVWLDRDGIAGRMLAALRAKNEPRSGTTTA